MDNFVLDNEQNTNLETKGGILDAVTESQHSQVVRTANPQQGIYQLLAQLPERERNVLIRRYGLESGEKETLEQIGKKLNLTRERVRQIEKESIKKLQKLRVPQELESLIDYIHDLIEANSGILTQSQILSMVLQAKTETAENSVVFILDYSPQFKEVKETKSYHKSWTTNSFDKEFIDKIIDNTIELFKSSKKIRELKEIKDDLSKRLNTQFKGKPEVLENILNVSRKLDRNQFGKWGMTKWAEINPKDVGDKAYLVLRNHGNPEHYAKITEMINKEKFDKRIAHKETVHNELIKDKRFVLVGRGIYALKEWGYKKGTVAEIIENILRQSDEPVDKESIIKQVLEQRMVKRNTVVVGLSNKSKFKKTADNKYTLVEETNTTNV